MINVFRNKKVKPYRYQIMRLDKTDTLEQFLVLGYGAELIRELIRIVLLTMSHELIWTDTFRSRLSYELNQTKSWEKGLGWVKSIHFPKKLLEPGFEQKWNKSP